MLNVEWNRNSNHILPFSVCVCESLLPLEPLWRISSRLIAHTFLFIHINCFDYILNWFTLDYLDPPSESICSFYVRQWNWNWASAHDRPRKIDEWTDLFAYSQAYSWQRKDFSGIWFIRLFWTPKKRQTTTSSQPTKKKIKSKSRLGCECEMCRYNCDYTLCHC